MNIKKIDRLQRCHTQGVDISSVSENSRIEEPPKKMVPRKQKTVASPLTGFP
jgi:hypothetical protein